MKAIILIAALLSICNRLTAQTRTLYGHVIADDLGPIPGVNIQNTDKLILGTTGIDGRFNIIVTQGTQTLLFSFLGYEPATVKLNDDCDTIEIVMMGSVTYDFMSSRKIDKLRIKRFNKLPELHLQAYKKGIFMKELVCYSRAFKSEKPELDSIEKEMVKEVKQIKLTFQKLNIGDTIKIPFSDWGGYRADGTDRTTLTPYSSFSGGHHRSGCVVKCTVIEKNKHKRAFNIVCKVVNCDGCNYPGIFRGSVMTPGEVFTYNMKYGEILDE